MEEKPIVYARLNWGNWIADCPTHGEGIAELVRPGQDFICSRCYPDIYATMKVPHPQKPMMRVNIPDVGRREAAIQKAQLEGHIYQVIFPQEKEQIMALVRLRPLQHMNWRPGETLQFLQQENDDHGVT